jgi:uncharacterized membrane protein YjfL (UPF0719 family)
VAVAPDVTRGAAVDEATRGFVRGGWILGAVLLLLPAARVAAGASGSARGEIALSLGAALLLWGAAILAQDRLLLGRALRRHAGRGNVAAAAALAANHVALAVIVARGVPGSRLHELAAAVIFAGIAAVTWAAFVALFRLVTAYSDAQEIAGENHAAAVSYAGAALALASLVGHAIDGPFVGWGRSLHAYLAALVLALALYPVRQLVVQGLLLGGRPRLRGGELDRAIAQRRSVGVAAVEAAAYLGTAWLLTGLG